MCSRYYMEMSPELRPIVERARSSSLAEKMVHDLGRPVRTEGEVRPTDIAPVIATDRNGHPSVFPMIWGFSAPDRENTRRSQPLINAKSETAAENRLSETAGPGAGASFPAPAILNGNI